MSATMPPSVEARTPLEKYRQDLQRDDFEYDPDQEEAVKHLQRLYDDLVNAPRQSSSAPSISGDGLKSKVAKLFGKKSAPSPFEAPPAVLGLYFWGGVGRGKTYLVDTFYETLPFADKMRTHFHRFMQRVHNELTHYKGEKNPLTLIAGKFASEARVICLDEFFVKDITDAMILANLLEALFAQGVVLVTTSNIVPDDLYKNGLQRARFIPAIDLLKRHCDVVNVDSGIDYRLRALEQVKIFYHPWGEAADRALGESFHAIAGAEGERDAEIDVNHRVLQPRRLHEDVVWFEFETLCDGPRSQNDYIELSREFHTVLVSNVPQMSGATEDLARRFINLVDEFYDRGVKLLLSAEVAIESLYTHGQLEFEFERTLSRLQEMQSKEYLALPHKP
ncbi:cell division protein ZapE [Chromohalobacter salexigens]|uniref:Cell division protein ZapE n=1 Tax=Chromohalobacter moromii TaxID=2860329 RepID=A0A9X3AY50_9GAMM|nr:MULTISPECIES: cell division protein ZapE [Chromohalobacter]NWO08903.1 cell division protein ZapE [Chromohalobacter salexigens]MCK2043756.1 AFG1 family ATPase [Chromohalobacter moromii]MCK2046560.1 AFG1 family ATPase [Chromohalobacter moromii]MCT8506066.1 AFG1 family ATPase [Chromohalobacter moromii]MCT8516119.1 AFG1 family ATPase [Chromohalobacter sp. TMW 2.2271]